MTQEERRIQLIKMLLEERLDYQDLGIPQAEDDQRRLLRSLLNVRPPLPVDPVFLQLQDQYLQGELSKKKVTAISELNPIQEGIYLWKGDITTLSVDAIVNAANSGMTGCYHPCHGCIDNIIHTYSGVQLRLTCAKLMDEQEQDEPTGRAKITPGFNLPCRYILHTVGPIITGPLTKKDCDLLASCYNSCLKLAEENGLRSIAFCCISTGEFHFPGEPAARIAIKTVREYREKAGSEMEVIFNVFKAADYEIYRRLLCAD